MSTNGGRYEMWCTPVGPGVDKPLRWIRVRFDEVISTGTLGAACGLNANFAVKGSYSTTDADGKKGFGATGFGANNAGGQEQSRPGVDELPGNQIAVFHGFLDVHAKIQLELDADCPKVGAVAVTPLKMVFAF